MNVSEELAYYGFCTAWKTLDILPNETAYKIFKTAADQATKRNGPGVVQLRKNLRRVCPEISTSEMNDLITENMRSHARYWCELFLMSKWSKEKILNTNLRNIEYLKTGESQNLGPVCVGSHSGNYDHATASAALQFNGATAVAERLKPEKLFQKFAKVRERNGIEVIPTGSANIIDTLTDRVQKGKIIALMGDRDLSKKGIEVTFFGERTKMPAGPALLAYRSGAPLIPVSFFYEGKFSCAKAYKPIEIDQNIDEKVAVQKTTQLIADALADGIRDSPQDWHMNQPLWLTDLNPHYVKKRRK